MKIALDTERTSGGITVAAVVRTNVSAHNSAIGVLVTGHKTPVALLFRKQDRIWASRPDGTPMTRQDVDLLCPDAWERFSTGR